MSILDDIKKLFFGAKSVATNAAEKAVETAKQAGSQIADSTGEMLEKAGVDKVGANILDAGAAIAEKTGGVVENVGGKVLDAGSSIAGKAATISENVGGKVLEVGGSVMSKAGDVAENVGGHIVNVGGDLIEKAGATAENVGSVVLDGAGEALDRAKEMASNVWDKTLDLVNTAQNEAAKENIDTHIEEVKDQAESVGTKLDESLLEKRDDFFEKARKFAEGEDK